MKATFTPSGNARWLPILLLLSWLGSCEAVAQAWCPTLYATNSPAPAQGIEEADFNGDGKPDLATVRSGADQAFVMLNCPVDPPQAVISESSRLVCPGTPAVLTINRKSPAKELTTAAPVTYEVTFSDNVTGVDASDFTLTKTGTLTGGTVGAVSGSGSTYQVVVSGLTGDGALRLDLNATGTGIRDGCNNDIGSGYTSGQTYTIDGTPPTITSITTIANYTEIESGGPGNYRSFGPGFMVTFSEAVVNATLDDFALTQDSDVNAKFWTDVFLAQTDRVFDVSLGKEVSLNRYYVVLVDILGGVGTLGLNFKATGSGITDFAGNPIVTDFTSSERFTVDKDPPRVESIKRQAPVAAVTGPGSVTFRVTFSEAVTGVDATDFKIVATGTVAGQSISSITAVSAEVYDVTVTGITGEGTLQLQVYPGYSNELLRTAGSLEALTQQWIALWGGIATIYDLGGFVNGRLRVNPYDFPVDFTYGEQYTISNAPVVASINPTTAQLSCANPRVRLTASAGSAYLWSTGATTAAIDVTTPGTYSVTVTNNNVTSVASATVTGSTQAPTASINPGSATLNCSNPTVLLTASGGGTYRWDDNSTAAIRSVSTAGTYSVTVTGANSCTASAQTTVVDDQTPPTAGLTNDGPLSCTKTSVTLTASGGGTYRFSNGANQTGSGNTATVNTAGPYSVTVTGTNGCTAVASTTVTGDQTPPTASINPGSATLNCSNPTVLLTASGGGTYRWDDNSTNALRTVSIGGTYSVTVTGANACTAIARATITMLVPPPSSLSLLVSGRVLQVTAAGGVLFERVIVIDRINGYEIRQADSNTTGFFPITRTGSYRLTVTDTNGCRTSVESRIDTIP